MKIFEANITYQCLNFLREKLNNTTTLITANQRMFDVCGIKCFFDNELEFKDIKKIIYSIEDLVEESDRSEYGDFQTNIELSIKVSNYLKQVGSNPKIIIEPTCGKGNFIVACLTTFNTGEYLRTAFDVLDDDIDVHELRIAFCYAMYIFFKNGTYLETEEIKQEFEDAK